MKDKAVARRAKMDSGDMRDEEVEWGPWRAQEVSHRGEGIDFAK